MYVQNIQQNQSRQHWIGITLLTLKLPRGADIRSGVQEDLQALAVAAQARAHERGFPPVRGQIDVHAGFREDLD